MNPDRFIPRLEEVETRDTPAVSPADVIAAAAGVDYNTAVLARFADHPSYVQSPTTQTLANAVLANVVATSDAEVAALAGADPAAAAQAQANGDLARALQAFVAANPAPKANAAVLNADGMVTVFDPTGTPVTNSTTGTTTGTTTTNLPGTTTTGGINLGNLTGGTGTTGTPTGSNTGAGTGTGTAAGQSGTSTTDTGTTGTTSGANTGTNGTGSTSGSGSTTGTTGTTSSTATP
jgi:hypothetical protein